MAKPMLVNLASEIFEKGVNLKSLMPAWLKADIAEVDIQDGWLLFEFTEPAQTSTESSIKYSEL